MPSQRKIIHIDMDCFFASIEMRDNPWLINRPLAIGGTSIRGVLSTANYEARKYGIHSAMSSSLALKRCPDLVIRKANWRAIKEASDCIKDIFTRYTDVVESLGSDEAYLDVSESDKFFGSATLIAKDIKKQILKETGLTASAGVSCNKFLAKVSSDWDKPNGLHIVAPEELAIFTAKLPVEKIPGVGKVTHGRLKKNGHIHCADILATPVPLLIKQYGKFGQYLYNLASGEDYRKVGRTGVRKSFSIEHTYLDDLESMDAIEDKALLLLNEFDQRLESSGLHDSQVWGPFNVKMKFFDFQTVTVSSGLELKKWLIPNSKKLQFSKGRVERLKEILKTAHERGRKPVRLLGLGLKFKATEIIQKQLRFNFV